MRKLGIGILVAIWALTIYACLAGEWIDKEGYPVHVGSYTMGDIK